MRLGVEKSATKKMRPCRLCTWEGLSGTREEETSKVEGVGGMSVRKNEDMPTLQEHPSGQGGFTGQERAADSCEADGQEPGTVWQL